MSRYARDRRRMMNDRIKTMWERWLLSHTRGERRAFRDLIDLSDELLLTHGRLSLDDLTREHEHRHGLGLRVAVAEVQEFHPRVMQALRDTRGRLVYPVTKSGYDDGDNVTPGDRIAIRLGVPGLGGPDPAFGWRLARRPGDPLYIAYENHLLGSARGGAVKVSTRTQIAATQGVLNAGTSVALPSEIKR